MGDPVHSQIPLHPLALSFHQAPFVDSGAATTALGSPDTTEQDFIMLRSYSRYLSLLLLAAAIATTPGLASAQKIKGFSDGRTASPLRPATRPVTQPKTTNADGKNWMRDHVQRRNKEQNSRFLSKKLTPRESMRSSTRGSSVVPTHPPATTHFRLHC